MKNLYVNVSRETRMVNLPKQFISVDGENLQSKLIFTFIDEFVNGQARLEYEIKGKKNYVVLKKENDTYTIPVKNVITQEGQIDMQIVITEGTNEEEIPVFKSNKFYLYCNPSINAVEKAPDGYELWIEQANVKLNQIDNLDIDIKDSVVTITKKDGTTKSENVRGEKGEKGDAGSVKFIIANELPTEDIDESAIYMIPAGTTTEGNTYEEYIYVNGAWESLGSASVNVDLVDYVKFNDLATSTKPGVVGINPYWGISIHNNGKLMIAYAKSDDIKSGTNNFYPIVPSMQHEATFYGLSKASQTEELSYTDEEKSSIRDLIGASAEIDLTQYVKNTDYATATKPGVIMVRETQNGLAMWQNYLMIKRASNSDIDIKSDAYKPIVPVNLDYAVMKALSDSKYNWTEEEKASARNLLNAQEKIKEAHVTLTQAEYDALVAGKAVDENTYYYIVEE